MGTATTFPLTLPITSANVLYSIESTRRGGGLSRRTRSTGGGGPAVAPRGARRSAASVPAAGHETTARPRRGIALAAAGAERRGVVKTRKRNRFIAAVRWQGPC